MSISRRYICDLRLVNILHTVKIVRVPWRFAFRFSVIDLSVLKLSCFRNAVFILMCDRMITVFLFSSLCRWEEERIKVQRER